MSPRRLRVQPVPAEQRIMRTSRCAYCGAAKEVVNGTYLRARREAQKLSLRDVARIGNLSAMFLSDVENNRRNPSDRALLAYVHAGVVDVSVLP